MGRLLAFRAVPPDCRPDDDEGSMSAIPLPRWVFPPPQRATVAYRINAKRWKRNTGISAGRYKSRERG
jgi:hypothetical protein